MYLHFLPFTDTEIVLIVEIVPPQNMNLFILDHQYHGCWWPGDARSQRFSSPGGGLTTLGKLPKWVVMRLEIHAIDSGWCFYSWKWDTMKTCLGSYTSLELTKNSHNMPDFAPEGLIVTIIFIFYRPSAKCQFNLAKSQSGLMGNDQGHHYMHVPSLISLCSSINCQSNLWGWACDLKPNL